MNGVKCDMSKVRRERWYFEHNRNPKMSWIVYHISQRDGVMTFPPPVSPFAPPYPNSFHKDSTPSPSSGTRISPAVLFIIVILAVLFFISGILHLLVRFLIKHPPSSADADAEVNNRFPEMSESDALQRQLQQLFHLHDSGLDQAFIDALPVFLYKEILGPKEPFDCAVCLSEFSEKDKLRLLPVCSHAFHINCIDAWLLSNSTCPLCRGTLFAPGFSMENPMFDIDDAREDELIPGNVNFRLPSRQKTVETEEIVVEKGVLPVRLGKFKRLNEGEVEKGVGETSSSNLDARRCFSMGSYQYVVGDSELRVALTNNRDGQDTKVVKGIEHTRHSSVVGDLDGKKICSAAKGDSFSVSKIWLWSKKGKFASSSDTELGVPSALNLDLPWMRKA